MVRIVTTRPAVATGHDGKAVAVVHPVFVADDHSIHAVVHVDNCGGFKTMLLTATKHQGLSVGAMLVRDWMSSTHRVLTTSVTTVIVSDDQLAALVPDIAVVTKLLSGLSCSEPASKRNAEAANAILSQRRLMEQMMMLPPALKSPEPPRIRCRHGHYVDCVASARREVAADGGVVEELRCTCEGCDQIFPVAILRHAGLMPTEAERFISQNSLPPLPSPLTEIEWDDLFLDPYEG